MKVDPYELFTGPLVHTDTFVVSADGVSGLKVYKTNGEILEYVVDNGEFVPLQKEKE